ncbi:MAG: SRPBCC family protein [Bdellovibrionota bacterium]
MEYQARVTKSFPIPQQKLFTYFADKSLVERWSYPEGMKLRLPLFEARAGGKYRYEHTSKDGTYVAEGYFKTFGPENIVQTDLTVKGPDGTVLFENLECQITFIPTANGTEAEILQKGFKNKKDADDCKNGWQQSLAHLETLIEGRTDRIKTAS